MILINVLKVGMSRQMSWSVPSGEGAGSAVSPAGGGRVRLLAKVSLAVLLLAGFATFGAYPLGAQVASFPELVGNIRTSTVVSNNVVAQTIRTGAHPAGYRVSEIEVRFNTAQDKTGSVKLKEDNAGVPGTDVAVFASPSSLSSDSVNRFTAQTDVTLEPDKTYWVVVNEGVATADRPQVALFGADDETGAAGWSIGDSHIFKAQEADAWDTTSTSSFAMRVRGTEIGDDTKLVSNLLTPGTRSNSTHIVAQRFTTGSDLYTLSAVLIELGDTSGKNTRVMIRNSRLDGSNNNVPDRVLATLTNPSSLTSNSVNVFTAPADPVRLAANTVYWITINENIVPIDTRPEVRLVDERGESGESGWSLANDFYSYNIVHSNWVVNSSTPVRMEIRGIAREASDVATLSSLAVNEKDGDPVDIGGFDANDLSYSATVPFGSTFVSFAAETSDIHARLQYLDGDGNELSDADPDARRFQFDLVEGQTNTIKLRVTAENGDTTDYTLGIYRLTKPGRILLSEQHLHIVDNGRDTAGYTIKLDKQPTDDVTITVSYLGITLPDATVNLDLTDFEYTFTPQNWNREQQNYASARPDADRTNGSYVVVHTASSTDERFNQIESTLVVDVDDTEPVNYHRRRIAPAVGSSLLPAEKLSAYLWAEGSVRLRFGDDGNVIVAEPGYADIAVLADFWQPTGIWGDADSDIVWVVDPPHFGIHPLKLSALQQGKIERHLPATATDLDYRFNYGCHLSPTALGDGSGNADLTQMWGDDTTIWVANGTQRRLEAYERGSTTAGECEWQEITSINNQNQPVTSDRTFNTPFARRAAMDYNLRGLHVNGIWSDGSTIWLSGVLLSGQQPRGIYTLDVATRTIAESDRFGHFPAYGIWSDGTTMWAASRDWLRAYVLDTGERRPLLDIKLRNVSSMPPGGIWSDNETIWVTNPIGRIDAYALPDGGNSIGNSIGNSVLGESASGELTASFSEAPGSHDGETEFRVRIEFSHDVQTTAEGLRERLLLTGGTLSDVAQVDGRLDLWELTIRPDGAAAVSIMLMGGGSCGKDGGALCTADNEPLTTSLGLQVPVQAEERSRDDQQPLAPKSRNSQRSSVRSLTAPEVPGRPDATAVFVGGVDLSWDAVSGAFSYDVQVWRGGWLDLPGDGVEIAFYGEGAIISGLDPDSTLWFRVRASNDQGVSAWSPIESMNATSQYASGRRPRAANRPASGAPVIGGKARTGATLWADTAGIDDADGLDSVHFRYQWIASDGGVETEIDGATLPTYIWTEAYTARSISVRVSFVDRGGYAESLTSDTFAGSDVGLRSVNGVNSPAWWSGTAILGKARVGDTLRANTKAISDADGLKKATFDYQWVHIDGDSETGAVDIADATGADYTLTDTDEGHTVAVRVSFADDRGNEESLTSDPTPTVTPRPNRPATGKPTIRGIAQAGETLRADTSSIYDPGGMDNAVFAYQWIRADDDSETGHTDIEGATGPAYTPNAADAGHAVAVRVSFADDRGVDETVTSDPTAPVAMAYVRLHQATVDRDEMVLTWAEMLDPSVTLPPTAFTVAADGSDRPVEDATVAGSEVVLALASPVEPGQSVRVSYQQPSGPDYVRAGALGLPAQPFSGLAVSNETAGAQPPAAPRGLAAAETADGAIALSWDDPADPTVTGYQILRRRPAEDPDDAFETLVNDTGSAATAFVDTGVDAWTEYEYRVRARNGDGPSGPSESAAVRSGPNETTVLTNAMQRPLATLSVGAVETTYLQGFTTGSRDTAVQSITLFGVEGVNSDAWISVEILAAAKDGTPGELLHTFAAPRRLVHNQRPRFAAAGGRAVELSASTHYFVRIGGGADIFELSATVSDAEDAASAPGWLMDDTCLLEDGAQHIDCAFSGTLRLSINGYEGTAPLPLLSLSDGRSAAAEGSAVEFAVTLSHATQDAVTVRYSTSDGTATADPDAPDGPDYSPVSAGTLTIPAGETAATISVPTGDDTAYEADETFTLTLGVLSHNARLGPVAAATGTILNNDADLTLPPAAPQGLTAAALEDGTVSLVWDDPADQSITGHQILRHRPGEDLAGTSYVLTDDTETAAASFADTRAKPGTVYAYHVKARNANGLSASSNRVMVLTRRDGTILVANAGQDPEQTLAVSVGGDGEPSSLLQGFTTGSHDVLLGGVTLADVGELSTDAELSVAIHAQDAEGQPAAQLAALSLSATLSSGQDATFAVADDATARLHANTSYWVKVDRVSGTVGLSATHSDGEDADSAPRWRLDDACRATAGATDSYADCGSAEALRVSIEGIEVLAADLSPPATPQGLTATAHDDGTVTLAWDDPGDPAVTGYHVWRANTAYTAYTASLTPDFQRIASNTASAAPTYTDTKTTPNTSYLYLIRARNAFSHSDESNHASAETPAVFARPDSETGTMLVSNLEQDPAKNVWVYVGGYNEDTIIYQGFRTGEKGALIDSVTLGKPDRVSSDAVLDVRIYEKVDSPLGDQSLTLTAPNGLSRRREARFEAPEGSPIALSADTSYLVRVQVLAGSLDLAATLADGQDSVSTPGWLIKAVCLDQRDSSSSITSCGRSKALRISINGTEPTASPATAELSPDATLSALELTDPDGAVVALTPAFASDTIEYTASVANDVESVTVTAARNHLGASVSVQTATGTVTAEAATAELEVGENPITVTVTSEDANTTRTYALTVTRSQAESEPESSDDPPSASSPVTGVTVEPGDAPGELVIRWNPHPAEPTQPYRVAIAPVDGSFVGGDFGGKLGGPTRNAFTRHTSLTVTGLVAGAEYKVIVRARYGAGNPSSDWSEQATGRAGPPPAD